MTLGSGAYFVKLTRIPFCRYRRSGRSMPPHPCIHTFLRRTPSSSDMFHRFLWVRILRKLESRGTILYKPHLSQRNHPYFLCRRHPYFHRRVDHPRYTLFQGFEKQLNFNNKFLRIMTEIFYLCLSFNPS